MGRQGFVPVSNRRRDWSVGQLAMDRDHVADQDRMHETDATDRHGHAIFTAQPTAQALSQPGQSISSPYLRTLPPVDVGGLGESKFHTILTGHRAQLEQGAECHRSSPCYAVNG